MTGDPPMAADPRLLLLMSYYRDAELRGANLLYRLMSYLEDGDSQIKLSLHYAEETQHAWLWTKRIADLGGVPTRVDDGYQSRIGRRTVPRNLLELLALTVVVEERSHARYSEHAARPDVDGDTLEILRRVSQDEKWHISWIRKKLEEVAAGVEGGVAKMELALTKYRAIDADVYAELRAKERALFGDPAIGEPA